MTKASLLTFRCGWHDIPDFDFSVADDHPVDKQLYQLAFQFEGGLRKSQPHAPTEIFHALNQPGQLVAAVHLGL
ncbi:MAG TPA: hypothetical protein VGE93_23925 [Bryobacteraceae bacterium]